MQVILDECVTRFLTRHLPDHAVSTVRKQGWLGIKNGRLLSLVEKEFDAFVSLDKSLGDQQDLSKYHVGVIVLRAKSNRIGDLLPLVDQLNAALTIIRLANISSLVSKRRLCLNLWD